MQARFQGGCDQVDGGKAGPAEGSWEGRKVGEAGWLALPLGHRCLLPYWSFDQRGEVFSLLSFIISIHRLLSLSQMHRSRFLGTPSGCNWPWIFSYLTRREGPVLSLFSVSTLYKPSQLFQKVSWPSAEFLQKTNWEGLHRVAQAVKTKSF